eukprot:scaffold5795_cov165-Amphora_coffeaeformis.AAC.5
MRYASSVFTYGKNNDVFWNCTLTYYRAVNWSSGSRVLVGGPTRTGIVQYRDDTVAIWDVKHFAGCFVWLMVSRQNTILVK